MRTLFFAGTALLLLSFSCPVMAQAEDDGQRSTYNAPQSSNSTSRSASKGIYSSKSKASSSYGSSTTQIYSTKTSQDGRQRSYSQPLSIGNILKNGHTPERVIRGTGNSSTYVPYSRMEEKDVGYRPRYTVEELEELRQEHIRNTEEQKLISRERVKEQQRERELSYEERVAAHMADLKSREEQRARQNMGRVDDLDLTQQAEAAEEAEEEDYQNRRPQIVKRTPLVSTPGRLFEQ